jgi:hypothetical protein
MVEIAPDEVMAAANRALTALPAAAGEAQARK